jgi:Zn-dependent alcohol dehydrogenase
MRVSSVSFSSIVGTSADSDSYMTGAATVLEVLKPRAIHSIAIFGMGAVGLCALMTAKSENLKEIVAVDIIESRLELASSLGATKTINGKQYENIEEAIHEILPHGVDAIVDATGSAKMLNAGVRALSHGGTLAVVGTPAPDAMLSFSALDMLIHCKKVMGVVSTPDLRHFVHSSARGLLSDFILPID